MSEYRVPWLIRVLYNHNPFYLISACLFTYGLKVLFRTGDQAVLFEPGSVGYIQPWGLLGSLGAVTILMAATAILIVRLGGVWEDARSLVLIVLLMLLAISASIDELVTIASDQADRWQQTGLLFGCGAVFVFGVCEMLISGLRLRLSWAFRVPLILLLELQLLWPALLLPEFNLIAPHHVRPLTALFPSVAAIIVLLLVPAVRQGSGSVVPNGTPWKWPLYPWTAFVFVGAAVCFRAYLLTMSFDTPILEDSFWNTTFGIYQLVPLAMAVLILIVEIGITEQRPNLVQNAFLAAPLLLVAACPWCVPWCRMTLYQDFAEQVSAEIGSPVFLTLLLLIAFSAYYSLRGIARAESLLFVLLLAAVFTGSDVYTNAEWSWRQTSAHLWPVVTIGILRIWTGFVRKSPWETLTGLVAFSLLPVLAPLQGALQEWRTFVLIHLLFAAVLVTMLINRSACGAMVRRIAACQLSLTTTTGIILLLQHQSGMINITGYAAVMTLLALFGVQLFRERWFLYVFLIHWISGIFCGAAAGIMAFLQLPLSAGVRPLILAALSFAAAVVISILKAGAGDHLQRKTRYWWQAMQNFGHQSGDVSPEVH